MKFSRSEVQTYIEQILKCTDLENWKSYRAQLEAYKISAGDLSNFKTSLERDASGYMMKGLLSLFEAISSIERKNYSWSIVKLYYSVFYLCRASLASKNFALIRNNKWYLLKIEENESPNPRSGERYRNDHNAVINTFIDLFKNSDFLQSNSVEGLNSYEWLSERRNQVNYQQSSFTDPDAPAFMEEWFNISKTVPISKLIKEYDNTKGAIIFQPEHAWIAIPFLLGKQTLVDFEKSNQKVKIKRTQLDLLLIQLNAKDFLDPKTIQNVFVALP